MKGVYPIFIAEHQNDFLVYVPDLDIYTEGNSFLDAMEMARDAIGLKGIDYEDDGKSLPIASNYEEALQKAKNNTDIFDYTEGILTMVDVDFTEYRRKHDNRMVKKNCTIPYYLNVEAEKLGINFSKVLQEALMQKIQLR
ncbi:MAG: type II toxin-antitoxin system HicB family antitoxin [Lachnospiraceae bacterium]|nr:type II toxin-antitoxin system HicB family antitoxin [Lachnospiraceae bacterium]